MNNSDTITVLTGDKIAAKVFRGTDKPQPAGWSFWFSWACPPVGALTDLHMLLQKVTDIPQALIIRDAPKGSLIPSARVRRTQNNFESMDHHWIMLDFDGTEAPTGQNPIDLHTVDWLIRDKLPPSFHDADYITHFSSSAGTAYAGNRIKVHLFFWLLQPVSSRDLKPWAASVGADPTLFNPVQPHFLANPIFETGVEDPFAGVRLFHVEKGQPEVAFVPPPVGSGPSFGSHRGNGGSATIVRDMVSGLIIDGREGWLLARLYSILRTRLDQGAPVDFATVEAEAWSEFQAECDLSGWSRATVAGKVHATLDRYQGGALPGLRRGTRAGLAPYYVPHLTPITAIRAALAQAGNKFFTSASDE